MSSERVLVLGGIRSGKSELAENLVAAASAASVRYIATAVDDGTDPQWTARLAVHRARRPQSWRTDETSGDAARLAELLADAKPDEVVLVDDMGGWLVS